MASSNDGVSRASTTGHEHSQEKDAGVKKTVSVVDKDFSTENDVGTGEIEDIISESGT